MIKFIEILQNTTQKNILIQIEHIVVIVNENNYVRIYLSNQEFVDTDESYDDFTKRLSDGLQPKEKTIKNWTDVIINVELPEES